METSVRVKKAAQTEFDIATSEGVTPGNLFQNQDGPKHLSTKGAMVETKVFESRKKLMYFIKVIFEGLS